MRKVSLFVGLALLALGGSARAEEMAPPPAADAPVAGDAATPPAAAAPAPMAEATPAATQKFILGVDAAFQLPLGNFADATGMGFGGLVRAEYNLIPNLNGTFRVGYIYALKKDLAGGLGKASVGNIPIWVGGKYFFTDMVYGGVEVGLNMLQEKADATLFGQTVSASTSENKFGGNVGAGVLISGLDVRAQLEFLDFGHAKDSMAVMINVGYDVFKM
jgi:hypothetical protein